uniref:Sulfatase N-terminal domain-containing protein n=1 Tax=Anopheles culicifacies TaxID=139723 RepID=A0A182MQ07_9DIPT
MVDALHARDMLENTIIVFSSDNGGPADGFNDNAASNWPLRGVKNTLWEGGVRGAGFIWSPLLRNVSRVSHQMVQVVWHELDSGAPTRRIEILHNIDDIWGSAALTVGNWKLVKGSHYNRTWDGWYGPAGIRDEKAYSLEAVANSSAGRVMVELDLLPSHERITQLRREGTVSCGAGAHMANECNPLEGACLFDVESDPCEYNNLADEQLHTLQDLLARLADYNSTAVPPTNLQDDLRGAPELWNYTWHNFGDELEPEVLPNENEEV